MEDNEGYGGLEKRTKWVVEVRKDCTEIGIKRKNRGNKIHTDQYAGAQQRQIRVEE